jgi:UDP-N-acetylmuramate--alanine ligase
MTVFGRVRNIHFVGIGGAGMSGIAEVLLNLGFAVSGSDLAETAVTRRLASLGASIRPGHSPDNIRGAQVVVISSAVGDDNPELLAARREMVPVIRRAEMLAELMRMKHGIAVAGAHGKTTTTSMIATIFHHGGLDPTVVIGGRLGIIGSGGRLGQGQYLVAEADESDGTFLKLSPTVGVITNIDREHMNFYETMDRLEAAFLDFANKVPFYGLTVLCLDDPAIQRIIPRLEKRHLTYGLRSQADLVAREVVSRGLTSTYTAEYLGRTLGSVTLGVPGVYNVYNSLAALAVALEMEIPFERCAEALAGFVNADRRFQIVGEADGVTVVDDYAHHPTEIKAALAAARGAAKGEVVAVFQPHRYSRTADLMNEFATAFYDADHLLVTEIYPAGEEPLPGVSGREVWETITRHGHRRAVFTPTKAEAVAHLRANLRPGDLLLTLGAGDVWQVGRTILGGGAP